MEMYFSILIILLGAISLEALEHPVARLAEGVIEGSTVQFDEDRYIGVTKTVNVYLGVPFAEPPTRFSPPIPKTPWQGVLDTKLFKPACMQPISNNFPIVDEDCLYLNVYAPHPRGVPFAEPPTRFSPPIPKTPGKAS
eukprot:XP_011676252.1 PREDICTED: acetylcholinesterase-like [Strongylocentrotus purpuratus]